MEKITNRFIALALCLTGCLAAYAYDFNCDRLYYNILSEEDRTVETTYFNFYYDRYISGEVVIPKKLIYNNKTYTVIAIGNHTFDNCYNLNSVTIPNSVTSIGSSAFGGCSGLTSISIPNSVTSIGSSAFGGCSGLTSISIPSSVTSIGKTAFDGCYGLTEISVETNNEKYSSVNGVLYSKDKSEILRCPPGYKTTLFEIPSSVTSIGEYAFRSCTSLISISITSSVTSIGKCAFDRCESLTSVSIPNSVTSIGNYAFRNCKSLTSVSIPNSTTSIGDYTFYECNELTSVSIPNSVTSIGESAFYGCGNLSSVSIPNSVTSIGNSAFMYCHGLTSVSIPNSVTSIGRSAFWCCGLTSITIPNSITSIGYSAFYGCGGLQNIYCMPTTPPEYDSDFLNENYMNATLYVPVGTLSAYEKVDPWRNFWNIEEYDFSGIEDITIDDYSNCPVEIYNLSGNKVGSSKESLSPGIYIMRQGRKVEKIMIQ